MHTYLYYFPLSLSRCLLMQLLARLLIYFFTACRVFTRCRPTSAHWPLYRRRPPTSKFRPLSGHLPVPAWRSTALGTRRLERDRRPTFDSQCCRRRLQCSTGNGRHDPPDSHRRRRGCRLSTTEMGPDFLDPTKPNPHSVVNDPTWAAGIFSSEPDPTRCYTDFQFTDAFVLRSAKLVRACSAAYFK